MASLSPVGLGYLTALLPLATTHLCYGLSRWQGHVPPCNPYWRDCVSISATGREGVAYFLFKGGILPTCVLLALFWALSLAWVRQLGEPRRAAWLGVALLGSLALAAYALALGHNTGYLPVIRRVGVALFIFCTFSLQVIIADALYRLPSWHKMGLRLLWFSVLILAIALSTLALDLWLGLGYQRLENAFEWWLFLLLNLHLLTMADCWRRGGLQLGVRIKEE
ncbi:hypothetical protein [Ferrimonas marina]|uniref:Frag1/DRAM/Sfk1 family protein n=1 Tax=Ferrimonas marina TaxID=299255 RepID=A0A1M5Y1A8_9GAMM|nr:hypothetical protein [Ferrimonas marina]SHI05850.1 hypothetical protein SAMN02745129_3897 [Ferrimonas marina]